MKITIIISLVISLAIGLVPLSHADEAKPPPENEWSKLGKSLFTAFTVLNVAEILQTRYIFESDDFEEANPVMESLGKDGTTAVMVGLNVVAYFVADAFGKEARPWFLGTITTIKVGCVGYNAYLGVGFEF
jgi:hypothetical protein